MRTRNSLVRKVLIVIALMYSAVLSVVSLANLKSLSFLDLSNTDKLYHMLAYFGLVVVWHVQYFMNTKKRWLVRPLIFICLFAIGFGILVELLQGTVTNYRTLDWLDMTANFVGVLLGFITLFLLRKTLERLKMKI